MRGGPVQFQLLSLTVHVFAVFGILLPIVEVLTTPTPPPAPRRPHAIALLHVEAPNDGELVLQEREAQLTGPEDGPAQEREARPESPKLPGESTAAAEEAQASAPSSNSDSDALRPRFAKEAGRIVEPPTPSMEELSEPATPIDSPIDSPSNTGALAAAPKNPPQDRKSLRERLEEFRAGRATQDTERAVHENRKKVQETLEVSYWNSERKGQEIGRVTVRLRIGRSGYVQEMSIVERKGPKELAAAAEEIVHLAEPLIYLPDSFVIELVFKG